MSTSFIYLVFEKLKWKGKKIEQTASMRKCLNISKLQWETSTKTFLLFIVSVTGSCFTFSQIQTLLHSEGPYCTSIFWHISLLLGCLHVPANLHSVIFLQYEISCTQNPVLYKDKLCVLYTVPTTRVGA